jgi:hypothetical protein
MKRLLKTFSWVSAVGSLAEPTAPLTFIQHVSLSVRFQLVGFQPTGLHLTAFRAALSVNPESGSDSAFLHLTAFRADTGFLKAQETRCEVQQSPIKSSWFAC